MAWGSSPALQKPSMVTHAIQHLGGRGRFRVILGYLACGRPIYTTKQNLHPAVKAKWPPCNKADPRAPGNRPPWSNHLRVFSYVVTREVFPFGGAMWLPLLLLLLFLLLLFCGCDVHSPKAFKAELCLVAGAWDCFSQMRHLPPPPATEPITAVLEFACLRHSFTM